MLVQLKPMMILSEKNVCLCKQKFYNYDIYPKDVNGLIG